MKKFLLVAALPLTVLATALGCTDAYQLPIAGGPPPTSSAPEMTQSSKNSPLVASVSPEGRGRMQDRKVSDSVRLAIINDPSLSQLALDRIRIETQQGKVIVAGIVSSDAQEKALLDKVKGVPGVSSVDDQVEVLDTN